MTNYLTVNDFKSPELRKACEKADTNKSGGIDTDTEFKNLINSIHTNNQENYCPKGHIYEGTENEIELVYKAYDKYKNDISEKFFKEYKDFIERNRDLGKILAEKTRNFPIVSDGGFLPKIPNKSNDFSFDQTKNVDKSNDKIFTIPTTKRFIPLDSDLGKQIGRVTNEFRPEVDGKYEPVYSKPDPLGRKEVIGYQPKNNFDIWY